MTVKIKYFNKIKKISSNIVLFVNEKFKINDLKRFISSEEFNYINELLKTSDIKKNMLVFEINSKKKIVLISIKNDSKTSDIENLGAEFYRRVNYGKNSDYFIISDTVIGEHDNFLGHFLHGLKLKSY